VFSKYIVNRCISLNPDSQSNREWGMLAVKISRLQILLAFVFSIIPAQLYAQQHDIAKFHEDPVEQYGARVLTVVILTGIAVVLFSLFRYKGKLTGPMSWAALALGVALLPMFASGFGTVLVFERAEKVEFCESCHLTMKAFVTDMKNPKSESLAAIHFKNSYIPDNQCYVCHTGYGLFGTVQAKREGLHDVYKYYTRSFTLPVKLRGGYPNNDCLKCHAGSVKWQEAHADFKEDVFAGKTSCLECHGQTNPAHNISQ